MATFTRNVPIATDTPTITVEGLVAGQHIFQLLVEDEAGNRSQPAIATVIVARPIPEPPPILVVEPVPQRLSATPLRPRPPRAPAKRPKK